MAEPIRTLANPCFSRRLPASDVESALARLHGQSRSQTLSVQVAGVAAHPHDDVIIATALSAQAHYLVTGDRQLLDRKSYRGAEFLTPRQFLALLESSSTSARIGPDE